MSFDTNLNGNGAGSEPNFASDVLDNLGMDDSVADAFNGNEAADLDLGDGEEAFESNQPQLREPQQQQQRQPQPQPQQRQQPQQQQQRPFPQNAEVRPDQRGNLVDANGRVVARAGYEARLYQDTQRARRDLQVEQNKSADLTNRLSRAIEIGTSFHTQVEALKAQLNDRNGAAARLGLNDQESIQAMQMMAKAKADPVNFIKEILTLAATRGVDLTRIGIQPGGIDAAALMNSIKAEISGAMNPLKQRIETEQRQQAEQAAAAEAYRGVEDETRGFFRDNPDAQNYIPVFHAVLSNPNLQHMSLGEVWARIQLNQMRMAQNQPQMRQQNPSARRNIPAGRGQPPRYSNTGTAPVAASYDSILRDTLDELGVV